MPPERALKMTLGRALKMARAEKGWQQQQLAKEAHISQKYLSRVENDHADPSWSMLVKLSVALDPYLHLDAVAWDVHRAQQEVPSGSR